MSSPRPLRPARGAVVPTPPDGDTTARDRQADDVRHISVRLHDTDARGKPHLAAFCARHWPCCVTARGVVTLDVKTVFRSDMGAAVMAMRVWTCRTNWSIASC